MTFAIRAVIVTAVAASAVTGAQAGYFQRATTAGQPVRIASHATWNADCAGGPAKVEVVVPPEHGRLVGARRPTTITRIETGFGGCRGHRIEAEAVIYEPAPGFYGTDGFNYTSTTRNGTVLPHQAIVDVR